METSRFDSLVRSLGVAEIDRRTLTSLLGGALLAGLPAATDARKEQRRKRKHDDDERNRTPGVGSEKKRKKKKKCKPDATAVTCAGTCGSVTNNCKQAVNCGSCVCPSNCEVCFTCNAGPNTRGTCVVDSRQVGDPCGAPGQVCQANGTCVCKDSACANPTPVCGAETCEACTSNAQCQATGKGGVCCNGSCFAGDCCDNGVCDNPTPICTEHTCTVCTSTSQCGNKEICDNGACEACDVCPTGCTYASPEQAIKDGWPDGTQPITVRICPGTYGFVYKDSFTPDVTLIGAGDGEIANNNTILDGPGNDDPDHPDWVARFEGGTSTLRGVRVTGGTVGGVYNNSNTTLNLANCTISGNSSLSSVPGGGNGGGISNVGSLFVTHVKVEDNTADSRGAGIFNFGSSGGTIAFSGDNLIAGNVLEGSGTQGSAIYNQGPSSVITGLNTVTFQGNDPETDQCHNCP